MNFLSHLAVHPKISSEFFFNFFRCFGIIVCDEAEAAGAARHLVHHHAHGGQSGLVGGQPRGLQRLRQEAPQRPVVGVEVQIADVRRVRRLRGERHRRAALAAAQKSVY